MTSPTTPTIPDASASQPSFRKLTPVLVVDAIEPALPFWTERLGFARVVEVPHGDHLGFVILARDGIEVMYQTWASVRDDAPDMAPEGSTQRTVLFIEVADLDVVERALTGIAPVVPRRRTFYGMDEIGVREPGGNVVVFASPAKG